MSDVEVLEHNFTLRRKRTYSKTFEFTDLNDNPLDLSGYVITSEMREGQNFSDAIICDIDLDLSDVANGNVTMQFDELQTAAIIQSTAFYDILFEIGDFKETWVEGKIEIRGSVTDVY